MTTRFLLLLTALSCACRSAAPFEGLAPAQQTGGPRVQFDLTRRPFPEIPFPNDLATRADPSSPTGLRVNASLAAPTHLERSLRSQLDQLDGFGVFAPITVAFATDAPHLDVADLVARQTDADPANDAVYLVDVQSGKAFPLDFGLGLEAHFPYLLQSSPAPYFVNDPFAAMTNLLFPTSGPFANLLNPPDPGYPASHGGALQQDDELLDFYERSTHTLVLRPVLPLEQERRYAVLLTERLKDVQGHPVVAPGSGINHPAQTEELRPILGHLPAGVRLADIAYAWAFTTQSTTREMESIRAGLNGLGPFGRLRDQFPVAVFASQFSNTQQTFMSLLLAKDDTAATELVSYRVSASDPDLHAFLQDPIIVAALGSPDPAQLNALFDTFRYIDYFVSGTFFSPSFLDQSDEPARDSTFALDPATGNARVAQAPVTFLLAVPKASAAHQAPFPVVIAGHGYASTRSADLLAFAGTFAKFGLATIAIDAYGHGIGLDPLFGRPAVVAAAGKYHLAPFANDILTTRARDLDGDGIPDPGADFWSANSFHTRDVVRQSVIDWMQLVRLLRAFDGATVQLFASNQGFVLAGDFNGDGIPDVGGPPVFPVDVGFRDANFNLTQVVYKVGTANPGSSYFVFGESLGGILSGILPAVEPAINAGAPVSGGGGLVDVALRTSLSPVISSVFLELLGPFATTCPYDGAAGKCVPGSTTLPSTLVMVVQDLNRPERALPIAPLTLQPGDKVSVRNLAQLAADAPCTGNPLDGCSSGIADANGVVRVPFSADAPLTAAGQAPGDPLRIEIQRASGQAQTIDAFGSAFTFHGGSYAAGDPLTALARGYGRTRNTPELRRLLQIAQIALEPGDPIAYAPHWFQSPLAARAGSPAPALVVGTVGDPDVPVSTAISMARAAGLVEVGTADATFGKTIDRVLIESGVVEGVPRTSRFADPARGPIALLPSHVRCDTATSCSQTALLDPTGYACAPDGSSCSDGFNAPRLTPALREQLQRPVRLADGSTAQAALLLPLMDPQGQHGFRNPQPGKPFDMDQFMANLIGRWFETHGRELHFEACQKDLATCSWIPQPPP